MNRPHASFWATLAFLMLLCGFAYPDANSDVPDTPRGPSDDRYEPIRIGVFYIDGPTGTRHLSGIKAALKDATANGRSICITEYPYINERQAVELYREATGRSDGSREVDIILGPTESDVFLRMREESRGESARTQPSKDASPVSDAAKAPDATTATETAPAEPPAAEDEAAREDANAADGAVTENDADDSDDVPVPVVSGLVTTTSGNEPSGWFFRTNVDVTRRAKTMYRSLNKYWIHSIAVLYANTEFGTKCQAAFAEELSPWQKKRYLPLIYDAPPDPSDQLLQILDARPDAIGFFGEREDIEQIYRELRELNGQGTPYRPKFFTLVDARSIKLQDLMFVSIASKETSKENPKEASKEADQPATSAKQSGDAQSTEQTSGSDDDLPKLDKDDDVVALGHDTAMLVLRILEKIPADAEDAELRRQFRDRLATRLQRSKLPNESGTWKEMSFINFTNSSPLSVSAWNGEKVETMPLVETIPLWSKLYHRICLIFNVWGWLPLLWCLIVISSITTFIVCNELRTMFEGTTFKAGFWYVVRTKYFWKAALIHGPLSVVLYIVWAESGTTHYDDFLTAAIIAAAPWALLKSLLDSPVGEKLGLKQFYEGWKARRDKDFMHARFNHLHAHVSVIAYHNSVDAMRNALLELYREHPSSVEGGRLTQKLKHKLQEEGSYFERRRICARLLLEQKDWEQLKADGLVPAHCGDPPLDPRKIVRAAAKHCTQNLDCIKTVRESVETKLKSVGDLNKKRHDELKEFLDHELADAKAPEAELYVYIRFLFVLFGFNIKSLKEEGLIGDEDYERFKQAEVSVHRMHAKVNVIAYHNSAFLMRPVLEDIYQTHPSPREGSDLTQELKRAFKSTKSLIERRRVCARLLLQQKTWEELKKDGIVPIDVADPPRDPEEIIRAAAKHCWQNEKRIELVRTELEKKFNEVKNEKPKRYKRLNDDLSRDLKGDGSPEWEISVRIRFLFALFGKDIEWLKETGETGLIGAEDYKRLTQVEQQPSETDAKSKTSTVEADHQTSDDAEQAVAQSKTFTVEADDQTSDDAEHADAKSKPSAK